MAGLMEGKVAFITGGARGQGRSHALRLAGEGADIIAVDLCGQVSSVPYEMSTPQDLDETVRLVEELDRRIVARQADVRDLGELQAAVDDGLSEFGHIDVVCANAGIAVQEAGIWTWNIDPARWKDVIDINLTGVWNTVKVTLPHIIERNSGGSIIITSSTAGMKGTPLLADYAASKHAVVGLMRTLAQELGPHNIRVNAIHPTGVRTPMIENDSMRRLIEQEPAMLGNLANLLPIDAVDPVDISNAVLWLASDQARYVTGISLPVDAGFSQK
jgi:SDR family mycofactocin-dependent oxidoreductase